ncbi:MAG: hypothetical protein ACLF0P_15965 [Thermoanaerobaculia bacterium]
MAGPSPSLDLFEETRQLLLALERREVEYALVGAVALAVHGVPRATTDIDLLIRPESLDGVTEVARELGFVFEAHPMRFPDGMEIRRLSKIADEETLTLDLLLVDANLEEIWASRRRVEASFAGAWVISRDALIRMKTWAGRDQDLADVKRLGELDR